MKTYQVSYYLGNMFHIYLIDSESEESAITKVIQTLPYPEIMKNLKIKRYYQTWN